MFTLGALILFSMTVSAVVWGRTSDAALVTAAVTLLGVPVFLSSGRKP